MKNFLIIIVAQLLKKNAISFDKNELEFQIQSHPSYPSLHAITGVLDHFNIDNVAADVPGNTNTLKQLPDCFIAQVDNGKSKDLVLVHKEKQEYSIFNHNQKKQRITEEDFLKKFTGIIVAVEKSEESIQPEKKSNIFKILGYTLLTLSVSFLVFTNSNNWFSIVYFGLSILGIIASVVIVKQELGLKTSIGDAFCSGANDKKDCDAVLSSKGAVIFKDYKLSDLSLLYFSGLTLLTFIQISNPVISFSLSLLAIPAIFYSIYYQYAIVKKWCLLCLSIVAILGIQALFPIISNTYLTDFVTTNFIVFGIVAFLVLLTWNSLKPLITEVHILRQEKIENVKFKRNYTLFESLLKKSPKKNTEIVDSKEIIFGNLNSNLEITLVTNPFCGHCKPVHKEIEKILHSYKNNVKIKIRFYINVKNVETDAVKITSRLIEIFNTKGKEECLLAMSAIYNGEKPNIWLKKWKNCTDKETYFLELEKQRDWCTSNAINFTPEILINGQSFPKEYNRKDLLFFVEDLEENALVSKLVII